ncbi:uncharacterized protein METZ01_LOCUS411844 [marine metagenome]|uniref:Uncharacterized protein n=1 Tax=marine metagenome TaxID=408172 RepID=A0A382WK34_9ZZZZ
MPCLQEPQFVQILDSAIFVKVINNDKQESADVLA